MARRLSTQATVVDNSVSDDEMLLQRGFTGPQDPVDHGHVDATLLAEDLRSTEQDEPSRDTIPARLADREVDECSSTGSESCWGETEDIGGDEVVEWGHCLSPRQSLRFMLSIVIGSLTMWNILDPRDV